MEEKEFEYNDTEMEELKKTIQVLEERNDALMKVKLPDNTDKYAIEFVKSITEADLEFSTTKEMFDKYLLYRRRFTTNGESILSVRMLNAVIRKYMPKAVIKHSNRKSKNTYFWVIDNDQ